MTRIAGRRSRSRSTLIMIILATIPCYCFGYLVLNIGREAGRIGTPTPGAQPTRAIQATATRGPSSTAVIFPTVTPLPTETITWTPSPTYTQFVPPTRTPTNTIIPTHTPTITTTPIPTPVWAIVSSDEGGGVIVHETPGFNTPYVASLINGVLVVVLSDAVYTDGVTWVQIRTPDGREGWVVRDLLTTATPAPEW